MEQHKLERQFREQLNSREIQPSEIAWEKLDEMLSVAEKPKAKFPWLYVAASFVGFVSMFYFSQKEITIEKQKNEVAIEHSIVPKINAMLSKAIDFKEQKEVSTAKVVQQEVSKKNKSLEPKQESMVVQNNSNQNQISELSIINQKKEQSVSSNINENSIDEMLAIAKTTLKSENSTLAVKVNPNALLSQVDGELELSFREKVINKVNKNYQTVKVVLTNRNQE